MTLLRRPAPLLLLLAALALLPFGRTVEIPMGILAMLGVLTLVRGPGATDRVPWWTLAALYAGFVVPMLLALPGAIAPDKSLMSTIGTLRFALSCCALLWYVQTASDSQALQQQLINGVCLAAAVLSIVWCLDGCWQFVTGRNILGYGIGEGYINGVFGDDDNIKLGLTLALLFPLGFVYALRHWGLPWVSTFSLLVLLLIILSGKRAAWITVGVELAALFLYYTQRGQLPLRRLLVAGLGVLLAATLAYASSDWVQQRSIVLVDAVEHPDYASLNAATGKRLPIWRTALRMGRAEWLTGVGPRGFRYAYTAFAEAGDEWAQPAGLAGGSRASHAHQLLLDLLAETGVIGLIGYLMIVALLLRAWRCASVEARSRALPFAVSLIGMLFPLNTHPAWYSSWFGLLLWLFIGLYLVALVKPAEESGA